LNSSPFERVSERLGIEEELLVERALDAYISSKLREIELEDHIMKRYGVSSIREFEEMVNEIPRICEEKDKGNTITFS